jgi:nucleoid-associated protein YgaU
MASRYNNIDELKSESGRTYRINAIYPTIEPSPEDTYIITTGGDRYDRLAKQFYDDQTLWWVIAMANNSKKDGLIVKPGIQLRIPADGQGAKVAYEQLNENR